MKTLTTLLIASATAISFNVNANSFLNETVDEEHHINQFISQAVTTSSSARADIAFLNERADEEYSSIDSNSNQNIVSVLNALDNNPPAAGNRSSIHVNEISYLNETVDQEYQQ